MRPVGALVLSVAGCVAGCGGASPPPCVTAASPSSSGAPPAASAPAPASASSLRVRLRPSVDASARVHVTLDVHAVGSALHAWSRRALVAATNVHATDAQGVIELQPSSSGLNTARDPVGDVHVEYDVASAGDAAGVMVSSDRFAAAGEDLLLLPDGLDAERVAATVTIDGDAIRAAQAASCLGVGATRTVTRVGRFLRRCNFVAGSLGTAVFDAVEGHDEAAWLGYTAFDPRAVIGELAQVRTELGDFFRTGHDTPMTYLLAAEARPRGDFRASARAESVFVRLGPSEAWGAPLRIAVTQQLMHAWIGGVLWVGPTDAAHEAESVWFVDGVARFLTARRLRSYGLLEPSELTAEVVEEAAEQATSPFRGQSNAAVAAHVELPGARADLVARGALYAALLDARIRSATKNARSLETVLRDLYAQGAASGRPLPVSSWIAALEADLGDEAARIHERFESGAEITLPDDALGPCYRAATMRFARFDLGYDPRATDAGRPRAVAALEVGGPAARAGVREGDIVESAELTDGRADVPVKLTVTRAGATLKLEYLPRGAEHAGQGWTRIASVPAERCGGGP
jgi:predicted metalloprotease with PDZ domain